MLPGVAAAAPNLSAAEAASFSAACSDPFILSFLSLLASIEFEVVDCCERLVDSMFCLFFLFFLAALAIVFLFVWMFILDSSLIFGGFCSASINLVLLDDKVLELPELLELLEELEVLLTATVACEELSEL